MRREVFWNGRAGADKVATSALGLEGHRCKPPPELSGSVEAFALTAVDRTPALGPGSDPAAPDAIRCRVRLLDVGLSIAMKFASRPKGSPAPCARHRDHQHVQIPPDGDCDVAKCHPLLRYRAQPRSRRRGLHCQPIEQRRIQPMHCRPAVKSLAHIARDGLLSGRINQAGTKPRSRSPWTVGGRRITDARTPRDAIDMLISSEVLRSAALEAGSGPSSSVPKRLGARTAVPEVTTRGRSEPVSGDTQRLQWRADRFRLRLSRERRNPGPSCRTRSRERTRRGSRRPLPELHASSYQDHRERHDAHRPRRP